VPAIGEDGIDTAGLETSESDLAGLLAIDEKEWGDTLAQVRTHIARFGEKLPVEFAQQMASFEKRLGL
jgi:GTP-dependent phosphoenolpyruvate carboxykinase